MNTQPKILKWSLVVGIIVVLNLFFNYSISLFYKEPDYNTYFPPQQVVETPTTKEACLSVGGQWYEGDARYDVKAPQTSPTYPDITKSLGWCDPNFTKNQAFNEAQKVYSRNIFILLVVLGVISIVLGAFLVNIPVSLGLSWGGVLSLIIASMRYWSSADNWVKVLILAVALGALIWLALKKFNTQT